MRVVAFYSSTCQDCHKAKKALADSQARWPRRIRIEHRDMKDLKVFVEIFAYDDHYGAKAQAPPKVFVGGQYLEGYPAIAKRLGTVIGEELAKGAVTFDPKTKTGGLTGALDAAKRRFETFGPSAVAAAGLLDGVNPCAFTIRIRRIRENRGRESGESGDTIRIRGESGIRGHHIMARG